MFTRAAYDDYYVKNCMSIAGVFESKNLDASGFAGLVGEVHKNARRKYAKEVTRNGIKYFRYQVAATINHGLARQEKPLPSGIPIQLTFNRAEASKSVLQIKDEDINSNVFSYSEKTVPLIEPTLSCYFVESEKADRFYSKSKMYDVSLDFMDYSVRRDLLAENTMNHNVKLIEGESIGIILGYLS